MDASSKIHERLPREISIEIVRADVLPEAQTWLDPVEKARTQDLRHPDRRMSFALGRIAARLALAKRIGCEPGEVGIVVGHDRAPRVSDSPYRVSIAHTGRGEDVLGAAAVSTGPVGIDLERIVSRDPALGERILQPGEWEHLDHATSNQDLVLLWSLKEAVLKALRTGLRRPARGILITSLEEGYAAAEAVDAGPWKLAYQRLESAWVSVAWPG